ncbi:MAG: Holliday junction resolvase RuvX [Pyrinomonadaceae bacterium]
MQEKETINPNDFTDVFHAPEIGRIVALDIGMKRFGVAVCDELQFIARPVGAIKRTSWKKVLKEIISILENFDAVALVLGLPYNFDGSESEMSAEVRRLAKNFSLSLKIPVFLQDERVTSIEAKNLLYEQGFNEREILKRIDSEAAAIILNDFLARRAEEEKRRKGEKEKRNLS